MLLGITTDSDEGTCKKKGDGFCNFYLVETIAATGSTFDLMISTLRVG